jgi:protein-tyrosine phosphatase
LSQVTAGALLGDHGTQARRSAETLVLHGLAQIISSDTHGLTQRKRTPQLLEALQAAEKLVGPEVARAMVTTNPARILSNEHLVPEPEQVSPQKWSLGRLFRRD